MRPRVIAAIALAAVVAAAGSTQRSVEPTFAFADPPDITWWALGDSYSSGEGLRYNDAAANPPDSNCERATGSSSAGTPSRAYSVVAKDQLSGVSDFRLVACTGAVTNQWREQWAEVTQQRADLVTMSFGGNNVGFSDVVMGCIGASAGGLLNFVGISPIAWAFNPSLGCRESESELRSRVDMLVGHGPDPHTAYDNSQTLPDMYAEIATEAVNPGGHVIVLGYPNLVEESGRWSWRLAAGNRCHRIRRADATMLRSVVGYLNQQVALAVQRANDNPQGVSFHFLDVSKIYESDTSGRHGLCTGDPWINGLTVGLIGPDAGAVPIRAYRSFHPTQSGHDQTGSAVAAMIRELDWGRLERTDGAVDRSAFEGYWSGTIVGPGGTEFEADVQLEIGTEGLVGTIVHPDLPCRGTMMEVSGAGSEVLFETTYTDESDCIQGGTHRLTTVSTDELLYEWLAPDSTRIDRGTLRRAVPPLEPGSVTIEIVGGGRSTYSDAYFADVLSVTPVGGFLIDVAFAATGGSDLRRPETTCLESDDGSVASPVATTLTVDEPGNYQGVWRLPVIRPGRWSLTYSCQSDYSSVPIADVELGAVGFAEYSSRYYVTVLSATRTGTSSVEVRFASHGDENANNDLRDPMTSCLLVDGRSIAATSASYEAEIPGQFYDGRLMFDFVPVADIEFLYSCQSDYTSVALPGV